jgi:phage-related protein
LVAELTLCHLRDTQSLGAKSWLVDVRGVWFALGQMTESDWLVCNGRCYSIYWGRLPNGQCQALDYYRALDLGERARAMALFDRMANVGRIYDLRKFNQETSKLYAFKPQPHRFFCFFAPGKRIFIVSAYRKQSERAPRREVERAERLRAACVGRINREDQGNEDGQA